MSENNVMDVFLAVKVDEAESDDLGKLLDTLQKISALQASFAATGGIELNVEVDQSDLENKVEELQRFLEEDFNIDTKLILDIKSDTDYIISRLWSVMSTEASEEQLLDEFLNVAKDPSSLIDPFIKKFTDASSFYEKRFGSVTEGKERFEEYVKLLASRIAKDITEGTKDISTDKAIALLRRAKLGAPDVASQTADKIIDMAVKDELSLQKSTTGQITGTSEMYGVGRLTQFPLVGQIESGKYTEKYEKFTAGKDILKLTRDEMDRLIQSMLEGNEEIIAKEVLQSIAKRLIAKGIIKDISEITFEKFKVEEKALLVSKPFRDILLKGVSKDTKDIIQHIFHQKKKIDDITTLNKDMLKLYDKDRPLFKKKLLDALNTFYKGDYASKLFNEILNSLSNIDVTTRTAYSFWQHFAKRGSYAKKKSDIGSYPRGIGGEEQEAHFAATTGIAGTHIMMTPDEALTLSKIEEEQEKLEERRAELSIKDMASRLSAEFKELGEQLAKGPTDELVDMIRKKMEIIEERLIEIEGTV